MVTCRESARAREVTYNDLDDATRERVHALDESTDIRIDFAPQAQ